MKHEICDLRRTEKNGRKYQEEKMKKNLVFWSWNGRLEKECLIAEMKDMKRVGIGGFFIHARAGLEVPYFSDEWFELIRFCAEYACSIGLEAYLYDENGWPSGTSDGAVPKKSKCYRQSWLDRCGENEVSSSDEIVMRCEESGKNVFWVRRYNPDYTDLLNREAVREFLDTTYEVYREKIGDLFGKKIFGIFTDEPQMSNEGYPFTDGLFDIFEERYGYSLKENLSGLSEGAEGNRIRLDYRALLADLYENSYFHQVGDWCHQNGLIFTGHLAAEDGLYTQIQTQADVMPCYRRFTVPGIDSLGRKYPSVILLKQVVSAAVQADIKDVLCEIFGASGHASTPKDWLNILFYETMYGINTICLHLSAYSALGRRKRDFPPTFSYHMNYFEKMTQFFDTAEKLCLNATEGKEYADILIIDPIESFFFRYRNQKRKIGETSSYSNELKELGIDEKLSAVTVAYRMFQEALLELNFDYHIGNEKLLRETAKVEAGKLKVGNASYGRVIIPYCLILRDETTSLLRGFAENGGELYFVGKIPNDETGGENTVLRALYNDGKLLPLTLRKETLSRQLDCYGWVKETTFYEEDSMSPARELVFSERIVGKNRNIFIANRCRYDRTVSFFFGGKRYYFHLFPEEDAVLYCEKERIKIFYPLNGGESVLQTEYCPYRLQRTEAVFSEERLDENLFVSDCCVAAINGKKIDERYVVRINESLNKKINSGDELTAEYSFSVCDYRGPLRGVIEDSDFLYETFFNGQKIEKTKEWFYDKDFSVYDLSEKRREGTNILSLRYRIPEKKPELSEFGFENVKNKFCEVVSLENVVLKGDFSVKGEIEETTRSGRRYFSLRNEFISGKDAEENLFRRPFYRGRMFYGGKFFFGEKFRRAFIRISGQYSVLEISLNKKKFVFYGGTAEITDMLKTGDNTLEITLFTSDRNLMGPHHYFDMDSEMVSPDMYAGRKGWFDGFNLHVPACRIPEDTYSEKKYFMEEYIDKTITLLFN